MNRPEVRIIDNQSEETKSIDISQSEREMLLAKYGYSDQSNFIQTQPTNELSFEEMCRQEEQKIKEEKLREHQRINGPKPITFDGNYNSNITYGTDDESGLNFKVTVVSDMPIPKNY